SAAAAALLTVAPVAATAIANPGVNSVAKADDTKAADTKAVSVKVSLANPTAFVKDGKVSDLNWNTDVT
ncbi:hypothetical protein, partial [Lactobacillus acetotolerans]|uniref:hypothetical protein n=1 Tax=Lactobacillus acetotolerans TaxID=1600 RepID=UPI00241FDB23